MFIEMIFFSDPLSFVISGDSEVNWEFICGTRSSDKYASFKWSNKFASTKEHLTKNCQSKVLCISAAGLNKE